MQFLFEEIGEACEDKSRPKQDRDSFAFQRYIIVTRVYADYEASGSKSKAAAAAGPSSSKKQKVGSFWV
jgi:hypothetical protein